MRTLGDLLEQVILLSQVYSGLHLQFRRQSPLVVGELTFRARRGEIEIHDSYSIEIAVKDFPLLPPAVTEVGGRIPRDVDHHVYSDGTLCLGPPVEVLRRFKRNPTLSDYIEDLVVPGLYWHSYNERHPEELLPAYSHGSRGIAEYRAETDLAAAYGEILGVREWSVVLRLIELACAETVEYRRPCPCASGKTLAACHGTVLRGLRETPYITRDMLALDYWYIRDGLRSRRTQGRRRPPR